MKYFRSFLTSFVLMYFMSISAQAQTTGSFSITITFNAQARLLFYYVPSTYNSSNQYKLIIGLHGCGGTGSGFRNEIKFLSDSLNAIIVCPQGLSANSGFMGGSEIPFVIASIDSTKASYNIDTNQIYLTGFSCNGYTTANIGLQKMYTFRGIIPFNPALLSTDFTDGSFSYTKNVPTCLCAGTADPGYNLDLRLRDSLVAHNAPLLFNSMPGIGHTTSFPTFKQEMMECFGYFSSLTGILENKDLASEITIFPNPTNSSFTIKLNESYTILKIFSFSGQLLKEEKLNNYENTIDIKDIAKGVYLLEVISEKNIWHSKIIKE